MTTKDFYRPIAVDWLEMGEEIPISDSPAPLVYA